MKRVYPPALTSPTDRPDDRVVVGLVGRPHGLDGTVVVHPETDHPGRFAPGSELVAGTGAHLTVRKVYAVESVLLVRFAEIADRTGAEGLRGAVLTIAAGQRRPLAEGEYWPEDLIGLEVRDTGGRRIGSVIAVEVDAPQTRLVISAGAGRVEIPLVADLVPAIDLVGGRVTVNAIPGLIE